MSNERIMDVVKLRHLRGFLRAFQAPASIRNKSRMELKQLKNIYAGKRCFIIGNGPSLTAQDLDLIKDEIAFAANRIYKIFPYTSWRPTYYCVQDINVCVEMKEEICIPVDVAKLSFFRMRSYSNSKELYEEDKRIIYVPIVESVKNVKKVKFSGSADRFVYDSWTVTYMSLQLAVYMGFTEIYLLGIDHSFPFELKKDGSIVVVDKNKAGHFYETKKDNEGEDAHKRRTSFKSFVTMGYEAAERYSQTTGKFRIYNATRGGELEVFERVRLEEVLNK